MSRVPFLHCAGSSLKNVTLVAFVDNVEGYAVFCHLYRIRVALCCAFLSICGMLYAQNELDLASELHLTMRTELQPLVRAYRDTATA